MSTRLSCLLPLAAALGACGGGDRKAPAAGGPGDAAAPRPAVSVDGCAVAWRPTADAITVLAAAPAAPAAPTRGKRAPAGPRPQVVFRTPIVVGAMDRAIVRRVVRKTAPGLEACYREALGRSPAVGGLVTAIFTVDATGTVVAARVQGPDDRLDGCLAATLRAARFPSQRGGGGLQVRYPIELHVEAAPAADDEPEAALDAGPGGAAPASTLRDLAWADEGVDPALARWAGDRLTPAVRAVTADLAACGVADATGSLVARLAVTADGAVVDAEVAGLGAAAVEDCVRERLARLAAPPPPLPVAIRCEITAHAPRPLRVTVRPGQSVIDVGAAAGEPQPSAGTSPIVVRVDPAAPAAAVRAVAARLARLRSPYLLGVVDGDDLILISDLVPRGAGPSPASPRPRSRVAVGADPVATARTAAACTDCDRVFELDPGSGDAAALRALAVALRAAGAERLVVGTGP